MKKIMFCGGGSAGHVIPNIALCEQLKNEFDLCYIGTDGIERDLCRDSGVPFYTFDGVKLVRGKVLCNLSIPVKLHKSVKECMEILNQTKPDLLFCKGGYVSYPPAVAAAKMGIPVLTHESDVSLGLANKLIAGKCRRVLTAFPNTAVKIKNGIYTGTPIRRELFGRDRIMAKRAFGCDLRPTVLVFGGGSGSKAINDCLRGCITELCRKYNILHVCGKGNVVYSSLYGYKQLEFSDDMGEALRMMADIDKICDKRPGLDCGSCGAPTCRAFAEDVVRGSAKENECIFILREEIKQVAQALSSMGGFVPGHHKVADSDER